ncbi:MAG: hypothetical protein COU30_00955, partial [Candidatus Magasanikbacteria bacterium CG10_big_fil_rev_8_21_14_0_10_38_6]
MVLDEGAKIIHQREPIFNETEKLSVMLGCLCHDLGKPETTKLGEKHGVPRIRSLGHSEAGQKHAKSFLANFTFGERVEEGVLTCVLKH